MPAVNVYKYPGIHLTTRLPFVSACRDLASTANNALVCILQKLYLHNNNSLEMFLKLFNAQGQPIAQYWSGLWGLDKAAMHSEKSSFVRADLKGF